jgi:hypothetical protein
MMSSGNLSCLMGTGCMGIPLSGGRIHLETENAWNQAYSTAAAVPEPKPSRRVRKLLI